MRKNQTFTILFYVKRTKKKTNGEVPVYCKVTINSKSFEWSINKSIKESLWDSKRSVAKGSSLSAIDLNEEITMIRYDLSSNFRDLRNEVVEVTSESLKIRYKGLDKKSRSLLECFNEHNRDAKLTIGINYSKSTYIKFLTAFKHLKDFLEFEYKMKDIQLSALNVEFIRRFESFLKVHKSLKNNSAVAYMKTIKKIVNRAYVDGYVNFEPFKGHSFKKEKIVHVYLEQHELERIVDLDIENARLEKVRDLFLFQCYSGLSFIDMQNLCEVHIKSDISGSRFIRMSRQKTKTSFEVPLLPVCENIIDKYAEEEKGKKGILPRLSNQKMNSYLKELAMRAGINKEITSHVGRRTFATTVALANGVPIDVVSKMLGHSGIPITQLYAKTTDERVKSEMNILKSKLG